MLPHNVQNYVLQVICLMNIIQDRIIIQNVKVLERQKTHMCVSVKGVEVWNNLQNELKDCKSDVDYKNMFKQLK